MGQYRIPADVATRVRAGHPWVFRDALGSRGIAEPTGARRRAARREPRIRRARLRRPRARDRRARAGPRPGRPRRARAAARSRRGSPARSSFAAAARRRAPRGDARLLGRERGAARRDRRSLRRLRRRAVAVGRARSPGATSSTTRSRRRCRRAASTSSGGCGRSADRRRPSRRCAPAATRPRSSWWSPTATARFGVDVTAPLGVGLFPDMRLGWAAVAARAAGRRVLEPVLVHRARSPSTPPRPAPPRWWRSTSPPRRTRARAATTSSPASTRRGSRRSTGDALKTLERFAERGRVFDLGVCDPPTFSHGPAGQFSVARDLAQLAADCARVLAPGGLLVFATNSTKVSAAELDRALGEGGAAAGADLRIIERVGLPPDFPVAPGFPEGNYLKVAIAIARRLSAPARDASGVLGAERRGPSPRRGTAGRSPRPTR